MLFPLSQQNENGIQAQEMWQLSQYLQVNVKQYIMFDQCVLIICHSWVDKWNFHAKKKSHLSCSYFNDKIQFLITPFFCLTGCAVQRTNAGKQTGKSSETYIRLERSSGGQHPGSCLWHWCVSLGCLDGYALHV